MSYDPFEWIALHVERSQRLAQALAERRDGGPYWEAARAAVGGGEGEVYLAITPDLVCAVRAWRQGEPVMPGDDAEEGAEVAQEGDLDPDIERVMGLIEARRQRAAR